MNSNDEFGAGDYIYIFTFGAPGTEEEEGKKGMSKKRVKKE